jgi:cytochrome c oxidase cbb3-type subunit 4
MLKFVKHHMSEIEGIEIYPILSLLIFFVFFTALAWWVINADKEYINKARQLPLEKEKPTQIS